VNNESTVFVVDDDPAVRSSLDMILSTVGMDVDSVVKLIPHAVRYA
jgi:FixJ family two-component response regulator